MIQFDVEARPLLPRSLAHLVFAAGLALALSACQTTEQSALDPSVTVSESRESPSEPEADNARFAAAEAPRAQHASRPARQPQVQAEARYYIEFRARDAQTYGHTYVMFGQLGTDGRPATKEIAGLHPASESAVPYTLGHFIPVQAETGPARGDGDDQYLLARHRIVVDKARYDEIVAVVREFQATSPAWHAVFYNCNAFVGDIARRIGLQAPGNSLALPQDYISELHRLNS